MNRAALLPRLLDLLGRKALTLWLLYLWAMAAIAAGLADSVRGLDGPFAFMVAVTAATFGWLLGSIPLHPRLAGALSGIFGVEFVLLQVGHLHGHLWTAYRALLRFLWSIERWRLWGGPFPNISPMLTAWGALWRAMGTLSGRATAWVGMVSTGTYIFDPIAAALTWGLILWALCAWGGWIAHRHHAPLEGIVPGGVLLTYVLYYVGAKTATLSSLLAASLILMGMMAYYRRERTWRARGMDFSHDLWNDLLLLTAALTMGLVTVSALAPSFSIRKITEYVREWTERKNQREEQIAQSLGLEPKPQPRPAAVAELERVVRTGLPRSHLIGAGPELSRRVAMIVKTGELPPASYESEPELEPPAHYWRSLTYDHYSGWGWSSDDLQVLRYDRGALATEEVYSHTRVLRQEVQYVSYKGGLIHVDGMLLAVNQPYRVAWRPPADMFAATLEKPQTYRADSLVSLATAEALRQAGTVYPAWVQTRYLQLPDELPNRVRTLAHRLTATAPTPYDRALAIERYLRRYPYTLDVPHPPPGRDIADYFLFDLQKGYCDYYATAMVVLARAAGLPARLAVGYASGTYDPPNARYIVTEADAHAWPEIYFPAYGWIRFEPTAAYVPPPHEREHPALPLSPIPTPLPPPAAPLVPPSPDLAWLSWFILGGGITLLLLVGATLADSLILLWCGSPVRVVTRLYRRLHRYSIWLGVPLRHSDTPLEVEAALRAALQAVGDRRYHHLMETATGEASTIVWATIRAWYTPHPLSATERQHLVWTWWKLRWKLWLALTIQPAPAARPGLSPEAHHEYGHSPPIS